MTTRLHMPTLILLAAMAIGCAVEVIDNSQGNSTLPSFENFTDHKKDTGYIGNKAVEIEATFTGLVHVMVPDKTPQELEAIAAELRVKPSSYNLRHISVQVTEQMKYARNMLKAEQLDLNLEGGKTNFSEVTVLPTGLALSYSVKVESLVKFKELEKKHLTPQDLVGKVIHPVLPILPDGLFERTGSKCSTDPDTGAEAEELNVNNLFYYFDPLRDSCPLQESELVTGRYEVTSSLNAPTVYPEYNLLVADKRIDMVAIYGQIVHSQELKPDDNGWWAFKNVTWEFETIGFEKVEVLADGLGHRLEIELNGLTISITMYNPTGFADSVPKEDSKARFRAAIKNNELIYYNGHAFYGSLNVLNEKGVYPENTYQIVFMDACWSYAYYTKQVFRNKATDEDPDGWALADVVNNTEPGITGSEMTAAVMWRILFSGALAAHSGQDVTPYSWNNMIKYMNAHAEERAKQRPEYPDPEIYGASGVRTNAFRP